MPKSKKKPASLLQLKKCPTGISGLDEITGNGAGLEGNGKARAAAQKYVLRLYVAGINPRSSAAIRSVTEVCEKHLKDLYELAIIDLYQQPTLAKDEQIIAAPTLIRKLPLPLRRLIGDMANEERVLAGLDLRPKKSSQEPGVRSQEPEASSQKPVARSQEAEGRRKMAKTGGKTKRQLEQELEDLQAQLAEAQETLRAIREGEVDAIVVSGRHGEQLYALVGTDSVYRLIVETMQKAAFTVTFDGAILSCNAQFGQFVKRPLEQILGHPLSEFIAPDNRIVAESLLAISQKQPVKQRLVFQGADGSAAPAHVSASVLNQPDGLSICVVATDLADLENSTDVIQQLRRQKEALNKSEEAMRNFNAELERKVAERTAELAATIETLGDEMAQRRHAEAELERTNQILRMLSACNEALVRMDDEKRLMQEICRIAVDAGGYRMAWVGVPEDDADKSARPVAWAGFEAGYLEAARISWGDNERGQGPMGTSIRTGQTQIGHDFLSDPRLEPWREDAVKRGYRSTIALPLRQNDSTLGALTIYAAEPAAFHEPQIGILKELAEDLAFGIMALRTRTALRESRDRLRALAGELTLAERRERRRLATVLHDHLQQLLASAKFRVSAVSQMGDDAVKQACAEIMQMLGDSIDASRSLTAELNPPILHEGGLAAGLEWLARWMADKHGLTINLAAEPDASPAADDVRVLVFESVRELLFNVVKHAQVKSASVNVRRVEGGQAQIVVSDDGIGFDPAKPMVSGASGGGFGLFSIRERLALIGGMMEFDSAPGKGSRFTLTAPLGQTAA